jgi:hypothetical protein
MPSENPIERLRARAAWFRALALEATEYETAETLLQMATETDLLISAVEEDARGNDNGLGPLSLRSCR